MAKIRDSSLGGPQGAGVQLLKQRLADHGVRSPSSEAVNALDINFATTFNVLCSAI